MVHSEDRIFFIHRDLVLHEKIIHVIKFRTMNEKKDESGALLPYAADYSLGCFPSQNLAG